MALAAPTGLAATVASEFEIDLTWNQVADAIAYDIERDGTLIVEGWPGLFYQDFDVVPSHQYSYRVRSIGNGIGVSSGFINVPQITEVNEAIGPWSSQKIAAVAQVTSISTVGAITVLLGTSTAIQVPAPTGGNDRSMIQAIIDAAPNGATIEFQPNATYLVGTGGIGVGTNKTQQGIILDGKNCLLNNEAASSASFRHCLKFGGVNNSGFDAIDCEAHNFRAQADPDGNIDWGNCIEIRSVSHDLWITNFTAITCNGDGIRVSGAGDNRSQDGPYNILVEDCVFGNGTTGAFHRHAGSVTKGHHCTFRRCTWDKLGSTTTGGTLFDLEPLVQGSLGPDLVHDVLFDDCEFRWYSPNTGRRSVQANGGTGSYVWNVTVQDCHSVGRMMGMLVDTNGGSHPRFHDFIFTGNVSDPAFVCDTATEGPVFRAVNTDFITITNNQANLGTSSFVSTTGCTNVTQSGNVDTS